MIDIRRVIVRLRVAQTMDERQGITSFYSILMDLAHHSILRYLAVDRDGRVVEHATQHGGITAWMNTDAPDPIGSYIIEHFEHTQ